MTWIPEVNRPGIPETGGYERGEPEISLFLGRLLGKPLPRTPPPPP